MALSGPVPWVLLQLAVSYAGRRRSGQDWLPRFLPLKETEDFKAEI